MTKAAYSIHCLSIKGSEIKALVPLGNLWTEDKVLILFGLMTLSGGLQL